MRINIGKKTLEKGNIEIFKRKTRENIIVPKLNAVEKIIEIINKLKRDII